MGRRTLLLISSILVAAVGTALVAIYVRGADERAEANARVVSVLVASRDIPSGRSVQEQLDASAFTTETVLQREKTPGVISDASQLAPLADQGLVTLSPITAGQVIQRGLFGKSAGAASDLGLGPRQMRMAVQLADPNRSAGFLTGGSHVAVFVTVGTGAAQRTGLVLDDVTVLSVGAAPVRAADDGAQQAAGGTATSEDAVPTTIVSVAVNQDQAQKLILAQKAGDLYFAILRPNEKGDPNLPATTVDNLLKQP
jgi:pilus assembly protein CpaB